TLLRGSPGRALRPSTVAEPGGVQGRDVGLDPGCDLFGHGVVIGRQEALIQDMFDPYNQLCVKIVEDPRRDAGPVADQHGMNPYCGWKRGMIATRSRLSYQRTYNPISPKPMPTARPTKWAAFAIGPSTPVVQANSQMTMMLMFAELTPMPC